MKNFLAIFCGTREALEAFRALPEAERKTKESEGMQAWMKWTMDYKDAIVFDGSPLGKTKRVDKNGVSDMHNELGAYVVVRAMSHEDAAKMFLNHPHFMLFPGDRVEVMEQLSVPPIA